MTRYLIAWAAFVPLATASAQDAEVEVYEVDIYADTDGPLDEPVYQNAFTIGAGALGAMNEDFDPQLPDSLSWNVRYAWHPINLLAWEFAYTGATDAVTEEAPQDDATLWTLAETGLKLELVPAAPVTPFLAGGVGLAMFTMAERDLDTMTVPIAAGLEARIDNLVLGTRATYRPAFFDEVAFSDLGADSWSWTADIGTLF